MVCGVAQFNLMKAVGGKPGSRPCCITTPAAFFVGETPMKTCSCCKQNKLLIEFSKNRAQRDGYCGHCKTCISKYLKVYQKTERYKARARKYAVSVRGRATQKRASVRYSQSEKGKLSNLKNSAIFRQRHPLRIKAVSAVNVAIASGTIPRPDTLKCACGKQAEEYHHYKGYVKEHWLDVVPKCTKCHNALHRKVA